jgi:hypothetical protein
MSGAQKRAPPTPKNCPERPIRPRSQPFPLTGQPSRYWESWILARRWRIVSTRQRTLVAIHEQLVKLIPGGVARNLSANKTAAVLRKIRPTDPVAAMRRYTVVELLAELRTLDRKCKVLDAELKRALDDYGTCLTNIDGIGPVAAATSSPSSVTSDASPPPATSPRSPAPHPSPRPPARWCATGSTSAGNAMNKVLHVAARVQSNMPNSDGRVYIHRKLAEGKTRAEATRSLKRHTCPTSSTAPYRPTSRHEKCPGRTARPRRSGRSRQQHWPGNHQVTSPDQPTVTLHQPDPTSPGTGPPTAASEPRPGRALDTDRVRIRQLVTPAEYGRCGAGPK